MRCDEGYRCEVCGSEVEEISDSDLYLRFVLGRVSLEELPHLPERHIRCNPVQAQFIVAAEFAPVEVAGPFSKLEMPAGEREREEQRTTAAWRRLQQLAALGLSLEEYPLPD